MRRAPKCCRLLPARIARSRRPPTSLARLDEEDLRTAGGIANAIAGLGLSKLGQQLGDLGRRVELARLLAGVRGEAFDQIDVSVADNVLRTRDWAAGRARGLSKSSRRCFSRRLRSLVLPRFGLAVEVDVAEDAFELSFVRFFNCSRAMLISSPMFGFAPLFIEIVEARALRQDETLPL